jgi:hypothetical protein
MVWFQAVTPPRHPNRTALRAHAALAQQSQTARLKQWKPEESQRTPFAILEERPPELSPVKRPRGGLVTKNFSPVRIFAPHFAQRIASSTNSSLDGPD